MARRTRRSSKLEAFIDDLGRMPDREIAEAAGVTPENVRTFRIRRGIPARWRGESVEALATRRASRAARAERSPRGRRSKLIDFVDLLGTVPDRELAEQAGVTPENVRTYRMRRGIPARWRGESDDDGPIAGVDPANGERRAYRVVASVGDSRREYVTFGSDMSEAARGADATLGEFGGGAEICEIRLLGPAL